METYKKILKTPSAALQAMIDGLHAFEDHSRFEIVMEDFGAYDQSVGICYGCAATCACQYIKGVDLDSSNIDFLVSRARAFNTDREDQDKFEEAIDKARQGVIQYLFKYFYPDMTDEVNFDRYNYNLPILTTGFWSAYTPEVEAVIKMLKEDGY